MKPTAALLASQESELVVNSLLSGWGIMAHMTKYHTLYAHQINAD
jgi:hypothetical protein